MIWKKRIKRALREGQFNRVDLDLAASFLSCAVGEHLELTTSVKMSLIPLGLERLGYEFYFAVRDHEPELALKIYEKIEAYPL